MCACVCVGVCVRTFRGFFSVLTVFTILIDRQKLEEGQPPREKERERKMNKVEAETRQNAPAKTRERDLRERKCVPPPHGTHSLSGPSAPPPVHPEKITQKIKSYASIRSRALILAKVGQVGQVSQSCTSCTGHGDSLKALSSFFLRAKMVRLHRGGGDHNTSQFSVSLFIRSRLRGFKVGMGVIASIDYITC